MVIGNKMTNYYSQAMKDIRNKVIKENMETTYLRLNYNIRVDKENGNMVVNNK